MCEMGVPVDSYCINIAIKCCNQLYRTNDGFAVLGSYFKRAIVPDTCTYTTLLDGLIIEDTIIEAQSLFKKLIKKKLCELDVVM